LLQRPNLALAERRPLAPPLNPSLPQAPDDPVRGPLHEKLRRAHGHFMALYAQGQPGGLHEGVLDYACLPIVMAALDTPAQPLVFCNSVREFALWLDDIAQQGGPRPHGVVVRVADDEFDHGVAAVVRHGGTALRVDTLDSGDDSQPNFHVFHGLLAEELDHRTLTVWRHHCVPVQSDDVGCGIHALHLARTALRLLPESDSADFDVTGHAELGLNAETVGRTLKLRDKGIATEQATIDRWDPPPTLEAYFDAHRSTRVDRRFQPRSDAIERLRLSWQEDAMRWLAKTAPDEVQLALARVRPHHEGDFDAHALLSFRHAEGPPVASFRDLDRHAGSPAARFWPPPPPPGSTPLPAWPRPAALAWERPLPPIVIP
jgi:hypothetical protein